MRPSLLVSAVLIATCGTAHAAGRTGEDLNRLAQNASCLIEAQSVVKLSSQAQGVLAKVSVRRGDIVRRGQVVATLESSVEEALLRGAQVKAASDAVVRGKASELSGAERKLARQRTLALSQTASKQTLELAETEVAVLKSQLSQAELDMKLAAVDVERLTATIERRKLVSPVDGVVASVDHYPGEYADSNTVVATLLEVEPLRIELYLPLEAYQMVQVGQKAHIRPIGPIEGAFEAQVTTKDRQIDAASNLFQIQLTLPNPGLEIPAGLRCHTTFDLSP